MNFPAVTTPSGTPEEHKPFVVSMKLEQLNIYTDTNWYKIKMSSILTAFSFLELINKL